MKELKQKASRMASFNLVDKRNDARPQDADRKEQNFYLRAAF